MRQLIIDHWRGQFGMVAAFWGILIYPLIIMIGLAHLLPVFNLIQDQVLSTRLWLTVGTLAVVVYLPWAFIGALRSILLHMTRLQATAGALGLLIFWGVALALTVHQIYEALPLAKRMSVIAFHGEGDELSISVTDNRMILSGDLHYGALRKIKRSLRQHPDIDMIELNLSAPHVHEARKLARLIRRQNLNTHVSGVCSYNCLIPFVAGMSRTATAEAQFEFYEYLNYMNGYRTDWLIAREREKDRQYFYRRGASVKYSYRLFYGYTDNAAYTPSAGDLYQGGLLTEVVSVTRD